MIFTTNLSQTANKKEAENKYQFLRSLFSVIMTTILVTQTLSLLLMLSNGLSSALIFRALMILFAGSTYYFWIKYQSKKQEAEVLEKENYALEEKTRAFLVALKRINPDVLAQYGLAIQEIEKNQVN